MLADHSGQLHTLSGIDAENRATKRATDVTVLCTVVPAGSPTPQAAIGQSSRFGTADSVVPDVIAQQREGATFRGTTRLVDQRRQLIEFSRHAVRRQ
jgi:hypothetical protein